jgi:adenosylcobyric acid synthase
MLGHTIADPHGVEGPVGAVIGLGLLDVDTVLGRSKTAVAVKGEAVAGGQAVTGYEIHMGATRGADCARPVVKLGERPDGATSADGLAAGTYVHGIFASDGFRRAFIAGLGGAPSELRYEAEVDAVLDRLAAHLERHLDIDALLAIAGYRHKSATATTTSPKRMTFAPR